MRGRARVVAVLLAWAVLVAAAVAALVALTYETAASIAAVVVYVVGG